MAHPFSSPTFQLIYRGTDISSDLDAMTTTINYVDHLHGKADEIDVTVHDKDGRWKGSWYPEHGDTMGLTIFDGKGGILPCGTFEMDEPNASGSRSGDTMTIRGLAAPISKALRTKKTVAYERQSLKDIVTKVASSLGMEVQGEIDDLFFQRVTQRRERDLEFIKRLAEETGHYCNLRGSVIIFTNFASIDGAAVASQIFHGDGKLISYDFKRPSSGTYSSGKASYLDEHSGKKIEFEESDPLVSNGDVLRITGERLENAAHASARVKSELHFANRNRFKGTVVTTGSTRLIAGNTTNVGGFGRLSGKRIIDSSSHTLSRGGYETTAELVDARK
jgi:phage protein D